MSKKAFIGGFNSLLGDQPKKRVGRPATQDKGEVSSTEEGTKPGETRATFIVKKDLLEKLKAVAYWDRKLIKEVLTSALEDTIAKYEKKNGPVKEIPKK